MREWQRKWNMGIKGFGSVMGNQREKENAKENEARVLWEV